MAENIKLIWDFRGQGAEKTAQHHEIHLKEYIVAQRLPLNITGFRVLSDMHSIAFMVVEREQMIAIRDILKPHRAEVFN